MIESKRITYGRTPPYKYVLKAPCAFLTDIKPDTDISHEYFHIGTDGVLFVASGYSWDGASGPAIDTKTFMRGSLAHDVFFQAHQLELPLPPDWRKKANKLLIRICREDGMSWIRSQWVYWAVSAFGRGDPKDLNEYYETLVAP